MLPLVTQYAAQTRSYHHERSTTPNEGEASTTPTDCKKTSTALPTEPDPDLPHLTPSQNVHMTQINEKPVTPRQATASGIVYFSNPRPLAILQDGKFTHKGDVYSVARIAGIMAAKNTPDIVPLCHPDIGITGVEVNVEPEPASTVTGYDGKEFGAIRVVATVGSLGRTGVEMEAMTAVMGAALTVYDMLKAVDKGMVIGDVQLEEKAGGKSGLWRRQSLP